jgi:hypothetical protein
MRQCRVSKREIARIPNRPLHFFILQNNINREYVQEMVAT